MGFHHEFTGRNIHVIHAYTYADETARLAATGFTANDVGKVCLQSDTASFYVLNGYDPIGWTRMADAAMSGYSGTLVVLDTDGNTVEVTVSSGAITAVS